MSNIQDNPWLYLFAYLEFDHTLASPEYVHQYLDIIRKLKQLAVQFDNSLELNPSKRIKGISRFVLKL